MLRPAGIAPDDAGWAAQVHELTERIGIWLGNDARVLDVGVEDIAHVHEPGGVLEDVLRDGIPLAGSEATLRRALRAIRSRS